GAAPARRGAPGDDDRDRAHGGRGGPRHRRGVPHRDRAHRPAARRGRPPRGAPVAARARADGGGGGGAMSAASLPDRIAVLRDEVLATAETGDREPPGAEVFDAVLRLVAARAETSPALDLALHDAISRRLAWGDSEARVLSDAREVCVRLLSASQRALRDPREEQQVAAAVAEAGSAAARIIALLVLGR